MGVSVLTQHNDNQRTGVNPGEPGLTPDAIRTKFRRLTELQVDPASEGGPTNWKPQIVAQPLNGVRRLTTASPFAPGASVVTSIAPLPRR